MPPKFPGRQELVSHFAQNPNFDRFLSENSENIPVWSASANVQNACNLYSLWKKRFAQYWNEHRKDRLPRIKFDDQLWETWHAQAKEIRACNNTYKLQGLQVLKASSSVVSKQVIRSFDTNSDLPPSHQPAIDQRPTRENPINMSPSADTASSSNSESSSNAGTPIAPFMFKVPSAEHRYAFNGVDVSMLFHAFQVVAANSCQELHMEDNVHHILAMSSILLVQKDRFHPDLVSIFGRQLLNGIVDDMHTKLNVGAYGKEFSIEALQHVSKMVKDVKFERTSRLDAMIAVYNLCKTVTPNEAKFLKSIARMIEKLPEQAIMDTIKETEHCNRFVDPILSSLFDEPEKGVLFRWTSVLNEECKQDSSISSARPDSVVSSMDGLYFGLSLGFAEVKPTTNTSNYLASKDLVRLGVLSKNSIDRHDLQACITMQITGFHMTLYLTTLLADGLYIMVEIGNVTIPSCIHNIPQYITACDDIISMLHCFQTWCSPSPKPQRLFKRRSLDDGSYADIVSATRSVKRRPYTSHR